MSIRAVLNVVMFSILAAATNLPAAPQTGPAPAAACWLSDFEVEQRSGTQWVIETWVCSDGSWYLQEYPALEAGHQPPAGRGAR